MSEDDFDNILEYSDLCDKHGSDAVDDYIEFSDSLDNFEETYCGEWDSEEEFSPIRSKLLRARLAHR